MLRFGWVAKLPEQRSQVVHGVGAPSFSCAPKAALGLCRPALREQHVAQGRERTHVPGSRRPPAPPLSLAQVASLPKQDAEV